MLTQQEVLELFNYCPDSGKLTWKVSRANKIKIGAEVCHKHKYGYLQVRLNGKLWMVHRVIWLLLYGTFPTGDIDHINGIRSDNRENNLRDVTRSVNMQNRKGPNKGSNTGLLGVTYDKQSNRYKAQMTVNKKRVLNKLFLTAEDAHASYMEAKELYHSLRK